MPDPVQALPYEIWAWCIELAIDEHPAGPLEFIMVSRQWQGLLLESPALWSRIYIRNEEDEMARIWTFLHLSKGYPLDVNIMTVLPTADSLDLIEPHLSRVKTISIRPEAPHPNTNSHGEKWRRAAACIMARFSNSLTPSDIEDTSWVSKVLPGNDLRLYRVDTMQFTLAYPATKVACTDEHTSGDLVDLFRVWEEHISSATPVAEIAKVDLESSTPMPAIDYATLQNVCMETLVLPMTRPLILRGSILVKNIGPFGPLRSVALVFTLDDWRTTSECVCKYVCALPFTHLGWDRFSYMVRLADEVREMAGRTVFMAARFKVPGIGEWWDNNGGRNYKLVFRNSPPVRTPNQ